MSRFSASGPPPRPTPAATTATPSEAGQVAAFDELLTHLTGSAKPADRTPGQSLTPPEVGAADPFAGSAAATSGQ